ncbi:MAG: hypothetical protein LOD85_02580 [Clostridia bacterium]
MEGVKETAASVRPLLAVVDWGAARWAARITARFQEELGTGEAAGWEVVCLNPGAGKALMCRVSAHTLPGAACLVVIPGDPRALERASVHFHQELVEGRADLVLVDCRLEALPALCEAVLGLPRWPAGWLGSLDHVTHESLKRLVLRVTERTLERRPVLCGAGG